MKNRRYGNHLLHLAVAVVSTLGAAAIASANSNGVVGVSGQNGVFCNNCHAGGTTPSVRFEGPMTVEVGSTNVFGFVVSSHSETQIAGGLDVSASDGRLGVVPQQGTQLLFGELTHSMPKANDVDGNAVFEFTWQAPDATGTYTLFGAGCSVNLNDQTTGDAAERTMFDVVVAVDVPTPTLPPTPTATAVAACVGDCSGDGQVTVDELITGTNIALGLTPLSMCPVFDGNGDGVVTIDEILLAVNSALNGCP